MTYDSTSNTVTFDFADGGRIVAAAVNTGLVVQIFVPQSYRGVTAVSSNLIFFFFDIM